MAFESEGDVARYLPRFIDSYNERRLHSAPGYLSPNRFEEEQPPRLPPSLAAVHVRRALTSVGLGAVTAHGDVARRG